MNPRIRGSIALTLSMFLAPTAPACAAKIVTQTLQDGACLVTSPLRLSRADLPAALGVAVLLGGGLALDRLTRRNLFAQRDNPGAVDLRKYGDVAQFSGLIFGAGFAVHAFITDNQKSQQTAWLAVESLGWATGISGVSKVVIGRARPGSTDNPLNFKPFSSNTSFPSGHTTAAFAAADVFAEQYPAWSVIVPVYAAATAVGVSRLYANQHWASDVVGGALLGTAVAHTLRKRRRHADTGWNFSAGLQSLRLSCAF